MTRLTLLAVLALAASAAVAQPVYNGLDGYDDPYGTSAAYDDGMPGVRVGLGVHAFIYDGPDRLTGDPAAQRDVIDTNLGVTAELTFPLAGQLYGRLMGGLVNIGADDGLAGTNPYLQSESILAEADLLYYVTRPGAGRLAPYVFSGISALFPTDGDDRVDSPALAIPVGLGLEYGVSRNLALFAEASYRFGLTDVGSSSVARALANASQGPDVCDVNSSTYNYDACIKKEGRPFCSNGGELPDCREVNPDGDNDFDGRFNTALIGGGLRLGFGGSPRAAYIPPPPPYIPPPVRPDPEPEPLVCDLVELNPVYFDYGSGTLDRRARMLLDENVELLLSNPACCVFIDGFTDTAEGDRLGMGLAGQRAQAVYDYYLSQGVGASRLQIRNRGVASPACDKEDPGPGCGRNRRVESLPVDCERFRFLMDNPSYDPY
ncbi:OmpA family protein [Rubrivirga sp. IMCC45206]|uniref:OmpA family protein n=1 Tax=Rubrivirga sp. IMCC45206 TaxID=3391614 RepID=UPI00399039AC